MSTFDNTPSDSDNSLSTRDFLERKFNRANTIYKALQYLVEPGAVSEIRAFQVAVSETYTVKTISGYYDHEHLYDLRSKRTR